MKDTLREYCEEYLNINEFLRSVLDCNRYIIQFKIHSIVCFYKYHAFIMYKKFVCTRDNSTSINN